MTYLNNAMHFLNKTVYNTLVMLVKSFRTDEKYVVKTYATIIYGKYTLYKVVACNYLNSTVQCPSLLSF